MSRSPKVSKKKATRHPHPYRKRLPSWHDCLPGEHFGRNLDGMCDHVLCVVDPSFESIMMAKRVEAFAVEANLAVSVVLNRLTPEAEKELITALGSVAIIGRLPDSRSIFLNNLKGKPLDPGMPEIESVCDALQTFNNSR